MTQVDKRERRKRKRRAKERRERPQSEAPVARVRFSMQDDEVRVFNRDTGKKVATISPIQGGLDLRDLDVAFDSLEAWQNAALETLIGMEVLGRPS